MRLSKEEFCTYVEEYEEMLNKSNDISEVLGFYDVCEWDSWLDNYYNLLSNMCDLPENDFYGTRLDWYCFGTEFGKHSNEIVHQDGTLFEIKNAGELYEYVMEYEVLEN